MSETDFYQNNYCSNVDEKPSADECASNDELSAISIQIILNVTGERAIFFFIINVLCCVHFFLLS